MPCLRFVTWNCRSGSVKARLADLSGLDPDIVFLQECAPAEMLSPRAQVLTRRINSVKGIALASLSAVYTCAEVRTEANRDSQSIFANVSGPAASGGPVSFSMLGLWAHGPNYVADVLRTLDAHRDLLEAGPTVVMGDLNSGTKLGDVRSSTANHNRLVSALGDLRLVSAYHAFHGVDHGQETHATYYHRSKSFDRWHIDFCFVPAGWAPRVRAVHVSGPDELMMSDHRPVLVEVDL